MSDTLNLINARTRSFADFPSPGVLFRDLGPVYSSPGALRSLASALVADFHGDFDVVLGIEARGFVVATAIAMCSGTPLVLARKPGKLPGRVSSVRYDLEYGTAELEIQEGDLEARHRVLMADDVLATGGTLAAAAELVVGAGAGVAGAAVIVELAALGGRARLSRLKVASVATLT